jgi:hypothetical protein
MKIMKMKLTNYLKTGILFFGISLLFWNCEKNEILEELNLQESELKTVPIENSMSFFKTINNNTLSKSVAKGNNDIGLKIDIESLEQVALTNTDAKLTIANASTKIENIETQILQIEIDGELQTVLFHHVPENNTAERTTSNRSSSSYFSGSVYTTNLSGMVLSGFKINNGNVLGSFNIFTGSYSTDPTDPICYTCGIQQLAEILIIGNPYHYAASGHTTMDDRQYQWSRSSNNYSSMGIAYANYYRRKAVIEFTKKDVWNPQDPYDKWNELTECEKSFFKSNTHHIFTARGNRRAAVRVAQKRFGNCITPNNTNPMYQTIGDAYRHAYFAALNTRNMGYTNAKALGDAHECNPETSSGEDKAMDLHNNAWGYHYGSTFSIIDEGQFFTTFMDAYNNGQIKTIVGCQ